MCFVHMISRSDAIIAFSQSCTYIWRQLYGHTWLGCIQLHQQKPFACNSPRNPLFGKQFFRHLIVQA